MKFACVDGPEFDGHKVDFDLAMKRNAMYQEQEKMHMQAITGGETDEKS
jgi:ferredoxin--NADP+ reductase